MERVTYVEQGRELLNNFNFQMFEGEVMGLVPLDSYGLDEFVDCVQNNKQLFYGRVYIREKLVNTYAVCPRVKNNVYTIFKDENLIQNLPGADNIFVIRKGYRSFWVNDSLIQKQLERLLHDIGLEIDVKKNVKELTTLEKYIIEIIKAYVGKADIVILKDIASSIHHLDMEKLEKVIHYYKNQGLSFIYISVRTEILSNLCDRVSLMSQGRIIKVLEHSQVINSLEEHYFFPYKLLEKNKSGAKEEGQKIFTCENLCFNSIHNMTFYVEKGECLLIHDYNNFNWHDFITVLLGGKPQSGKIWWGEKEGKKLKKEIAIILENPTETMLFPEMTYEDNLCFNLDHKIRHLWWSRAKRKSIAREIVGKDITCKVKDLSLKEKYGLVYNKILLQKPQIVFCFFPYRNVDVKTQQFTNSFLKKYLLKGIAVVIITLDILDGISLADRILLFGKNNSRMIFDKEEFERIVLCGRKNDCAESTKKEEKNKQKK